MSRRALGGVGDRFAGDVFGGRTHPNNPGSTPSDVLRRSSRETVNRPCTSTGVAALVHHADAGGGQPAGLTHRAESALLGARDRDQHPAGGLGEQA